MTRPPIPCTETRFAAPLECFGRADIPTAGGKAANLGELLRAGFPVPPGFTVTTAAYDRFVAQNGLQAVIERGLADSSAGGAAIRAAFEATTVPPEVAEEIFTAYRQLAGGPVAVRSSATAEDLPEAAFAGQQDTFLNVVGPAALLEAVRRCWASLWTDRAIAYRARQQVDAAGVKLAVVVQRMAPAAFAGVMFTANPLTGARGETVIDASPGLGEAVVSGLVTPDHYVLRHRRWGRQVIERRAGRREVIVRPLPGGGTEHVEGAAGPSVALPDRALRQLASLGERIERHFGAPQDIEWAWQDGTLSILQARPITALPEAPPHANRLQRLLSSNFAEMLPVRPYPLDVDTWLPALSSAVDPIFHLLGMDWELNQMFDGQDGVIARYSSRLPRPTWRVLLAPLRLISLIVRYDPTRWQSDPLLAEALAAARALDSRRPEALSWAQLLDQVDAAKAIPLHAAGEIRCRYFPGAVFAAVRLRLLLGLLGRGDLLASLLARDDNLTFAANQALEDLAGRVRTDPVVAGTFTGRAAGDLLPALEKSPAGRAFLGELAAFLDRFGHRETVISTALEPTWKDAPGIVLGLIKSLTVHPPQQPAGPPAWETAQEVIFRHPLLRFGPLRAAFRSTLAKASTALQLREDTHFYATLPLPLLRRTFFEMGRRLTAAGALDRPEDVFHLRLAELQRVGAECAEDGERLSLPSSLAAELRAAADRRKTARAALAGTPLIDPRLMLQHAPQGDELLRGISGSPGVAAGPARIVRTGAEFDKLAAGDVLVAPHTNPAWTPLFQRAAAVVVDTGSPASHAAIVAREYGIPAVMATQTGTRVLRDGEMIRVDGSRGAVYRLSDEDRPASAPATPDALDRREESIS